MNCQQFNEIRIEVAKNLPLKASTKSDALTHIEQCPYCMRLLKAEKKLLLALALLQDNAIFRADSSLRESALLESFRQSQSSRTISAPSISTLQTKSAGQRHPWLLTAAALIPLVLTLIGYTLWKNKPLPEISSSSPVKRSVPPPLISKQMTTTPAEIRPSTSSLGTQLASPPSKKTVKIKHSPHTLIESAKLNPAKKIKEFPQLDSPELMTEFIEIAPMEDIYPQEMRQVVRVRLPRGNLTRFGFPVNAARIYEPVQADLLLTQEGWVKAVRLVK